MKFSRIRSILRKQPRLVTFGGGSGMRVLLQGLKKYTENITAVVAMSDNGGSSGRLRREMGMLPPGDVRNCILALSDSQPLLASLFDYRFDESDLKGHNFGNLFLTALTKITGSFEEAVDVLTKILNVRGHVIPVTTNKVSLVAEHPDGTKSTGEVEVARTGKSVTHLYLKPDPGHISDKIIESIAVSLKIILIYKV